MAAGDGKRRRRPSKPTKPASQFERTVEDLMGKRFGRGYIYYGERQRLQTDEEVAAETAAAAERGEAVGDDPDDGFLKENPVLVTGGTGRTGQWVTLGLLNQGFNVRVLTRSFEKAEKLFGPSGANVDVFEGDVADRPALDDAMDGAVALVIATAPEWWRAGGSAAVEGRGAVNLIESAAAARTVKRIVLLSTSDIGSARGESAALAEEALRKSGVPYVIVRIPRLSEEQGGMSSIVVAQAGSAEGHAGKSLTRVDAAQVVCQALVYDRTIQQLREADPDGGFIFGNHVLEVANADEPSIIDKSYWKRVFAELKEEE